MTEVLATTLQRPQEQNVSIERAHKLGAKSYDGTNDSECALSWLETNKEIFQVMGCTEELMVTYSAFLLKDRAKEWAYVSSVAYTQFGLLVEAATGVERSMAVIPRPKEQKHGWTGGSQGGPSKTAKTEEALETAEGAFQYAINVEKLTQESARRVIQGAIDVGMRVISSETALMWGLAVDQKIDLKHQGIPVETEDSREVEPSLEDLVVPVSPIGELVGVGHLEDNAVDHMFGPVYSQLPSRRLMLS
ncbi:hypothetical protein JRO89_XS06G0224600 [Xanthoceras sorbifolium]|uniref:Uncharacterized protein n=1 Tax=Xanthoceras sorbifolium TaxID=99658 RepID=A0ABQ8HZ38_9ROSI|nr:hypothetical protein JRO89_XS06G0224600 [Xanthoceras sorbifolium]